MRLPLAVDLVSRDGGTDRDAGGKNYVIETNGDQSAAVKRPGVGHLGNVGTGAAQLMASFRDNLKVVVGDTFKEINSAGSTTASAAMSPIFPGLPLSSQVSANPSGVLMIKTSKEAWIYTP